MAWKNLIASQVDNAFDILDDLTKSVVWTNRLGDPVFSDGEYVYANPTDATVKGVPVKYDSRKVDGVKIQSVDQELVLRTNEVSGLTANDLFNFDGKDWKVIDFELDPSETIWMVQVRPI